MPRDDAAVVADYKGDPVCVEADEAGITRHGPAVLYDWSQTLADPMMDTEPWLWQDVLPEEAFIEMVEQRDLERAVEIPTVVEEPVDGITPGPYPWLEQPVEEAENPAPR